MQTRTKFSALFFYLYLLDIYGSIFELDVKAVLENLTVILKDILTTRCVSGARSCLAVQTKSRNFSTRTLRYGTACYGKTRGPKKSSLDSKRHCSVGEKLYEDRCMYGGMDHSQPQGVAVTQGNCGTAGSLYCMYSSKLLCKSKNLLLLSDFNTVKCNFKFLDFKVLWCIFAFIII